MKKIGLTFLTALIGGAVAIGSYKLIEEKNTSGLSLEDKQKVYFANNPINVTSSAGDVDFVQAAAAVTPAVVHIKTTYSPKSSDNSREVNPFGDMFDDFFGGRRPQRSGPVMASGSGVIISDDGYIVTNNHVVEDASKIDIILPDNRSYEAKVIGRDPNTDLALVKVNATGLPIVKLGNSDNVNVGEWVLAVGYPFTLNTTVTAGIVSAKGRDIGILNQPNRENYQNGQDEGPQVRTAIESFIQTDAAINRGNSGGALVNTKGELIGINAAIASQSGNYEGYGFAIPINLAKKIIDDFMKYGSVKRGYVGINYQTLDAEIAKRLGTSEIRGLYVSDVVQGSGAQSAGLKKGDIITKVDGNNIIASSDLQERVARLRPGDKVQLTYLRDGKTSSVSVTLKEQDQLKLAENSGSKSGVELFNKLGASFAPATAAQKQKYKITSGVVVSEVRSDGLFEQMDVPRGTIITAINGKPVNKVDDIDSALSAAKNNRILINGISPDGSRLTYQFLAE